MQIKYKCSKCRRYIKSVPVKRPRVAKEVQFVCKKCGTLKGYEVEVS